MNIMYYNNCYPPIPVMFYAAEDIAILLALKLTRPMIIVILLLVCYTRTYTDRLFFDISLLFHILRFDNFLLNEDDDDDCSRIISDL